MTSTRYRAYRRMLDRVDDLVPLTLGDTDQATLRDMAEGLLLTRDGEIDQREEILTSASLFLSMLFGTRRITAAESESLWAGLAACGPQPEPRPRRHPSLTGA